MRTRTFIIVAALLACAAGAPAGQGSVTMADVQRLQDATFDASDEIAQVRGHDASLAAQLERDLDVVRDDIAYLRGKLRREGNVSQKELGEVRSRLEALRARARTAASGISTSAPKAGMNEVPVGAEIDVRLLAPLSSATAQIEDRFEAATVMNVDSAERVLIPAGSLVRGIVSEVKRPGRLDRRGSLSLSFDQITVRGTSYPLRATVTQALESEGIRGDVGRIGAGAGVGAIIGGVLGGFKGALAGILIGGGGVLVATEGRDLELPAGTILRLRLDTPLTLP